MNDSPDIKDRVAVAAVTGAGATVGGAGGATVGVLELAARGAATGLSAGVVIGAGAAAGAAIAYGAIGSSGSESHRAARILPALQRSLLPAADHRRGLTRLNQSGTNEA